MKLTKVQKEDLKKAMNMWVNQGASFKGREKVEKLVERYLGGAWKAGRAVRTHRKAAP